MLKRASSITFLTLLILLAFFAEIHRSSAVSWSAQNHRLTDDIAFDGFPAAREMDDGKLWILWTKDCLDNYTIYYKTSSDSGKNWSNENNITRHDVPDNSNPEIVQLSNGTIMVVWQSNRPPTTQLGPDFSLHADPESLTIPKGDSDNTTISVTSLRNFNNLVRLTILYQPEGVESTLNPETVTPPPNGTANSTLTVSVNATATTGDHTLTVLGTSGKLKRTVTISLQITESAGTGNTASTETPPSPSFYNSSEEEADASAEDYEIFYKTSNDYGENWSEAIQITNNTDDDTGPSIVQLSNGTIMVVWQSDGAGSPDIAYATTSDGTSWTYGNVTIHPDSDKSPSIIQAEDGRIWVAWSSNRTGDNEIFYKIYSGSAWLDETRRTYSTNIDTCPSIVQTLDKKIWIFWSSREDSPTATGDIYYKYSSDNGESWSVDTPFIVDGYESILPATTQAHDTKIWIVWTSDKDENWEIYYRTSLAGDVNGDGFVDLSDLFRVAEAYGSVDGEPEYDVEADLNTDGVVDVFELAVIGKNYGET